MELVSEPLGQRHIPTQYEYAETSEGGRINITTVDPESLTAVHAFLKFQIADHKTGDQPTVRER